MTRSLATLLSPPLLLLVFCSSTAQAYCLRQIPGQTGNPAWSTPRVSFYVSSSLAEIGKRLAVEDAFAAWSDVPCTAIALQSGGSFAIDDLPLDGTPASAQRPGIYVYWHSSPADWPLSKHDVVATSEIRVSKGGIVRGVISVNAFRYRWSIDGAPGTLDVQGELTALVGRVLGIADSDTDESVMTDELRFADWRKRELRPDDMAALRALYPDSACGAPPPPGPDGCGAAVVETTSKRLDARDPPGGGADSAGSCAVGCAADRVCPPGRCVEANSAADSAGGCSAGGAGGAARAPGLLPVLLLLLTAIFFARRRDARAR